jgi:hypothetical protein
MTTTFDPRCDDLFYSQQFFANTRIGHTSLTAEFGTPAMVWQVSVWPRRYTDPHEFDMRGSEKPSGPELRLKNNDDIRREHSERLRAIVAGFNDLLISLKQRGCVIARDPEDPFPIGQPLDWDPVAPGGKPLKPFDGLSAGARCFTLWWPDRVEGKPNLLEKRLDRRPLPTDLRVRIQADAGEHFSTITFILDAGKPWNGEPVDGIAEARARGLLGERRGEIFRHVENIHRICEKRLEPQVPQNAPLVDVAPLPERICELPPDPADKAAYNAWLDRETKAASELKDAADYLYGTVWDEFREDFGFGLGDITGEANVVFANFRGLVMSTKGFADPCEKPAKRATHAAMQLLPRFTAGHDPLLAEAVEPKAVVQAFQPFMRRFRPGADWRDWIACGIFDRRAIYITPLGSRSEYRELDEGEIDAMIPARNLPGERLKRDLGIGPELLPACAKYVSGPHPRTGPVSGDDRPEPFRYLILTKHAPNRRLVGRMIDRINMTGVRRLYALKNWSILQQANTWVRIYGQKLDEAYAQWIDATDAAREKYERNCDILWDVTRAGQFDPGAKDRPRTALSALFAWLPVTVRKKKAADLVGIVETLRNREAREEARSAVKLRTDTQEKAVTALLKLYDEYSEKRSIPRKLILRRARDWKAWREIRNLIDRLRETKEDRDIKLARHNQSAELALVQITRELDRLGQAATGGITYRINRSRYFAELYRKQVDALADSEIETWWSYSRFAKRGMEPTLRLIEGIGESYFRLHEQLQSIKQDILQSSINNQTESTRDNTYKLERIQAAVGRVADATEKSERRLRYMKFVYYFVGTAGPAVAVMFGAELMKLRELFVRLFWELMARLLG